MRILHSILEYYKKALKVFLALSVFIMSLIVFVTVISRYVLQRPLLWGVEAARIILVWLTFCGAALIVAEQKEVRVEMMEFLLSKKLFSIWNKVIRFISLGFLAFFGYYAFKMSQLVSIQVTYALRIPFYVFYIPMLIFTVSAILFTIDALFYTPMEEEST